MILRTIIVSGKDGVNKWMIITNSYYLLDSQDTIAKLATVFISLCFIVLLLSIGQLVIEWFKRNNSI